MPVACIEKLILLNLMTWKADGGGLHNTAVILWGKKEFKQKTKSKPEKCLFCIL